MRIIMPLAVTLLVPLLLAAHASAYSGTVTREVVATGEGVFEVKLLIGGMDAAGIVERLPEGAVLLGTDLPPHCVKMEGETLALVAMNRSFVSYSFRWSGDTPVLEGTWEDLIGGMRGEVQELEESAVVTETQGRPEVKGASPGALLPVLGAAAGALLLRMKGGRQR